MSAQAVTFRPNLAGMDAHIMRRMCVFWQNTNFVAAAIVLPHDIVGMPEVNVHIYSDIHTGMNELNKKYMQRCKPAINVQTTN